MKEREMVSGRLWVLFILILALLVAAGCQGNEEPAAEPDTEPAGEVAVEEESAEEVVAEVAEEPATFAQGVTEDSIKIGIFGPFSGNASVYSKAQDMAMAVYKNANANGGVNGRQIEIVEVDSACDPTTVQGIIRRFAEQDEVFMIHGGSCSSAIIAARPAIEAAGIPMLTMNAASGAISNPPLPNLFQPKPTADELGRGIVEFIASNPEFETVAIVGQNDEWGRSFLDPAEEALAETDLEVVVDEQMDPEAGDATAQVRKLLQAEPDVAIVILYPQPMSVFLRDAYNQGLDIPIITGDGARPEEQVERIGDRAPAENLFSAYTFTAPVSDPSFTEFAGLLAEYYPNDTFDAVALEGAISSNYNLQLLEALGEDLTWENWIETAENNQYSTLVGGDMQFLPFEDGNPRTRRPGIAVRFSALDPNSTENTVIVIGDWSAWAEAAGG